MRCNQNPCNLSPSELKIAECMIRGLNTLGCARELHLSRRTVESHLSSIYYKLGIKNDPLICKMVLAANILKDFYAREYLPYKYKGTISEN